MVHLLILRSKAEVRMAYYGNKEEEMIKEENCNSWGLTLGGTAEQEGLLGPCGGNGAWQGKSVQGGQEERSVVYIMTGSLNCCLNHLREGEASQCSWGLVGNLIDYGILSRLGQLRNYLRNVRRLVSDRTWLQQLGEERCTLVKSLSWISERRDNSEVRL